MRPNLPNAKGIAQIAIKYRIIIYVSWSLFALPMAMAFSRGSFKWFQVYANRPLAFWEYAARGTGTLRKLHKQIDFLTPWKLFVYTTKK
jgi:hypothetical protein